jgi:hypothetical protein
MSQNSSTGIATGCGMNGCILIPGRAISFYLLHSIQTGFGTHTRLYSMGRRDYFPGDIAGAGGKLTNDLNLVPM